MASGELSQARRWHEKLDYLDYDTIANLYGIIEAMKFSTQVQLETRNRSSRGLDKVRDKMTAVSTREDDSTREWIVQTRDRMRVSPRSHDDELKRRITRAKTLPDDELRYKLRRSLASLAGVEHQGGVFTYSQYRKVTEAAAAECEIPSAAPKGDLALEQQIEQHAIRQLEEAFEKQLRNMSDEERKEAEERFAQFVHSLDAEQQANLREFVGSDQLSAEAMRRIAQSGAISAAVIGGTQIAGFGAYLALSGLIHSISSLVGVTLPFAVYTGASSALAALSGGLVLIPAGAFGLWQYRKRADRHDRGLLPITLCAVRAA